MEGPLVAGIPAKATQSYGSKMDMTKPLPFFCAEGFLGEGPQVPGEVKRASIWFP
ncbi:hypothetical protein [Neolewinella agarilytica]|uniref:hypothetical protein n=1 Tax=Neolewinella agarilytica TaxID=478744 RepID=UPI001587C2C1|nr:hypothetical protein [Neolewinella agarilytica]